MAAGWALVAEVDCPEPRVELGSIAVAAGGDPDRTGWDESISTGIYRDPARRWVMPTPLPFTAAWRTTTTGDYVRLLKTDYTLTTSAAWIENPRIVAGNVYLEGNGTNERVTSTASYSADAAWYVSIYIPSVEGLDDQTVLYFGMGAYATSTTISVHVRANGAIAVYKGASGGGEQIGFSSLDFAASKQQAGKSVNQTTLNLVILPIRHYERDGSTKSSRGELLIITDGGTSFSVPFEGLGSSDTITQAGVIWWTVPQGRPSVQVAPCKFTSSATLYGPKVEMPYPPDSPRGFSYTSWAGKLAGASGTATASLVDAASLSAYTPDGTTDEVRIKVAFSGAIAVAAVDAYMPPEYVDTDNDPTSILEAMESLSLSVADWKEGGAATVKLTARLANLVAAGITNPHTTIERPFRLALKDMEAGTPTDLDFFRGVLRLDAQESAAGLAYPVDADLLTFTGYDRSYEARMSNYLHAIPFDGLGLVAAVELALAEVGFDGSYTYGSTSSYTIPTNDPVQGKWTELPERGQNVGDWIEGIWERHGSDWWRGWVPTISGYLYRTLAPSDLVDTEVIELFHDRTDALAAGFTATVVPYRVVYGVTRHELMPEANQVIVLGQQTSGARKLLLSQSNDAAAQNPATVVASRPAEWVGRVHRVLEINPGVTTQAQADALKDTLADRLGVIRHVVEIDAPMLVIQANTRPLWTGDVVKLWAKGRTTYELLRITAVPSLVFEHEATESAVDAGARPIRRGTYRTERIGSG